MEYLKLIAHFLTKAVNRRLRRKLRRMERKLQKVNEKYFAIQKKYILKKTKQLLDGSKSWDIKKKIDSIDEIFENMPDDEFVEEIIANSKAPMVLGAGTTIKKHKLGKFGISFDLQHPLALEYLQTDRPLLLAKLSETTKNGIKPILEQALSQGWSYTDTAKLISENYALSDTRATMIAVNEIGHAYEVGNMIPLHDANDAGLNAQKYWSTVRDDKVTEQCATNEGDGWIGSEELFTSGDDSAPRDGHPRCRCTTKTRIVS